MQATKEGFSCCGMKNQISDPQMHQVNLEAVFRDQDAAVWLTAGNMQPVDYE